MAKLKLEVVTPEKILFQREALEVQIPTQNGEIGILPGHTPLVASLAVAGVLKFRDEGNVQGMAVVGNGFVEISNDKISILASLAELPQEIDLEAARHDLETAERALKSAERDPEIDVKEALVRIERAAIRVQAAQGK